MSVIYYRKFHFYMQISYTVIRSLRDFAPARLGWGATTGDERSVSSRPYATVFLLHETKGMQRFAPRLRLQSNRRME